MGLEGAEGERAAAGGSLLAGDGAKSKPRLSGVHNHRFLLGKAWDRGQRRRSCNRTAVPGRHTCLLLPQAPPLPLSVLGTPLAQRAASVAHCPPVRRASASGGAQSPARAPERLTQLRAHTLPGAWFDGAPHQACLNFSGHQLVMQIVVMGNEVVRFEPPFCSSWTCHGAGALCLVPQKSCLLTVGIASGASPSNCVFG